MADNTQLNTNATSGDVIGTDDIGGVKYQRIKIITGADGVNGGDVTTANPFPAKLEASTNNIGDVDVLTRPAATPNKTGGSTLLSLQTCASGAVVIGSAIDISGKLEVSGTIHVGRTITTALSNPARIRLEVSPATSGNDTWSSIAEFLSSTIASTTTATLTTGTAAAATTLPMTATAAILIGDIVYIQEAGGQTDSEFRRVITINTNTSIVVEEGCTYAHTITTTKVWSKADKWNFKILVGSNMRMRMVVDCAYALSGQTIVAEGKYSTLDSIV